MKKFLFLSSTVILMFLLNSWNLKANVLPILDDYLAFAEVMPEPVGGIAAVYKNVSYPASAKNAGTQGKVFLMVMVNENGGVDDVKVVRGIGNVCDEAAIEGVKKSKFKAGQQQGKNVKVKLALAIEFKLK